MKVFKLKIKFLLIDDSFFINDYCHADVVGMHNPFSTRIRMSMGKILYHLWYGFFSRNFFCGPEFG